MLHFIRDLNIQKRGNLGVKGSGTYNGSQGEWTAIMYWFLRLLGYSFQWQCSGDDNPPNKIPDGNCETAGTGNWSGSTAAVSKNSGNHYSGTQCLQITAAGAGEYAESDSFTNIDSASARTYHLVLRAANNTGSAWDVQIYNGTSFASVGSIPDNGGVMTHYHFSYTTTLNVDYAHGQLRIVAPAAGTVYVDEMHVFYDFFEFVPDQGVGDPAPPFGASPTAGDGQILNGDEFSSSSYSFVGGDIGKILIVIDPTLRGNSGAYEITSINGTNAVLDLRVAGNEVLRTSAATLRWRMLDLDKLPRMATASTPSWFSGEACSSGFVLESPHANKWRFGFRNDLRYGSVIRHTKVWASPIDGDVDADGGDIYQEFPSTMRDPTVCERPATFGSTTDLQYMFGGSIGDDALTYARCHLMASDGGEFFMLAIRRVPDGADAGMFCGIVNTSDALHSTREAFALGCKRLHSAADELGLESSQDNCFKTGHCGAESSDMPTSTVVAAIRTINWDPINNSESGPSPYSGEEWRHRPVLVRDYARLYGEYSHLDIDIEDALWFMRSTLNPYEALDPINGAGDGTTAKEILGTAPNMTLKDTDGLFTAEMVGKEVTIAGCSNANNNGTFVVTAFTDVNNIIYTNASGVAESPLSTNVTWECLPQLKHMRRGVVWACDGFTGII